MDFFAVWGLEMVSHSTGVWQKLIERPYIFTIELSVFYACSGHDMSWLGVTCHDPWTPVPGPMPPTGPAATCQVPTAVSQWQECFYRSSNLESHCIIPGMRDVSTCHELSCHCCRFSLILVVCIPVAQCIMNQNCLSPICRQACFGLGSILLASSETKTTRNSRQVHCHQQCLGLRQM